MNGHPEDLCQRCGGPNIVWHADNELWNRVMGGSAGIVCPICFVMLAEAAGLKPTSWRLIPAEDEKLSDSPCQAAPACDNKSA